MRRLMLCIVTCVMLLPALAQAYDVLVVQSRRDAAYDQALKSFRSSAHLSQRVLVLSDYAGWDIAAIVRDDRPLMILAIGDKALEATRSIRQVPVIGLMSLGIHDKRQLRPNLSGVGMFAAPGDYLRIYAKLGKRRIGVVYDPAKSGWYLRQARSAAQEAGVELVLREVNTPRETPERLASLAGRVDALWMLPDTTAVTRDSAEAYFRFAQEQRIPLISFSSAYLGLGAAVVVELDRSAMGVQAAAMATAIANGAQPAAVELPRGVRIMHNSSVLRALGLSPDVLNDLLSYLHRMGVNLLPPGA